MKKIVNIIISLLCICGCSGIKKVKDLSLDFELNDEIKEVMYYASLAPSGHNAQNWIVEHYGDSVTVILDSSRLLKEVDPKGRQALISVGAFIQNMLYAFEAYGYSTDIEIFNISDINNKPLVARIVYKKEYDSIDDKKLALMLKRKTFKGVFDKGNISTELITKLIKYLAGDTISNVYFYRSGSREFTYIKENSFKAMEMQVDSMKKRIELAEWLRFSDEEALEKSDGLPAEMLGMSGIIKKLYYMTTDRSSATGDKFAKQSIDVFGKKLESTDAFFVITGGTSNKDHIHTGMFMEKFWLKAAELDISLSVTSQIFEEFSQSGMQKELQLNKQPQMIFGTGKAEYGESVNLRRPVRNFLLKRVK